MKISERSWHCRMFKWGLKIVDDFVSVYGGYERCFKNRTNLCHYMRTILIYLPLVFLVYLVTIAAAVFVLIALPIIWFGISGYGITIGVIAASIGLGFILYCLIKWATRSGKRVVEFGEKPREELGQKEPGFLQLFVSYIVAMKQKICPLIEFVNRQG